ncbi:erythromycin esterase family protein, partial [Kibdelosporangium lantanae]
MNDWLRDATHPLRTLDPSDPDDSDLAPLRDIVGSARVVALGESMHRVHEFYSLRHRVIRYLVRELGFTAVVMESGFPEGLAVDDWVLGGPGSLDTVLSDGITYHMGKCAEMRDQLTWMRTYNSSHSRPVRFYGMDIPDSSASARPAILAGLSFLDTVDPSYAAVVRSSLLPLFSYLPTDRTGLAWAAPTLQAYMALPAAVRYEMTAKISEFVERVQAMRVVYSGQVDVVQRCLATGRHADAFLAAMA